MRTSIVTSTRLPDTSATSETSPSAKARVTGAFYLLTILLGVFAEIFVGGRTIVNDDATATASNILAHQSLFQLGFAVYLVEMTCNITITVLFFELLKPASRSVSLLAACLSLVACGIKAFGRLFFFVPLLVLSGARYLTSFHDAQLRTLSLLILEINDHAAAMSFVFFGFYALLKGYLILRSTFLPRIFGVLSILAGIGLLTFLYQPLGYRMLPVLGVLGLVGALPQIVWLIVVGVNEQRWREQASTAASSIWA